MTPLVVIPGLGSDGAVWQPTIDALGDAVEAQVGDTLHDDSFAGMAARILSRAPNRFALAGVSMGGMVALEIMRTAPERVTRLALVDTNARPDTPDAAARRRATIAMVAHATDIAPLAEASLAVLVRRAAPAAIRDAIVAMGVRVGRDVYLRQNTATLDRGDQWPILATIGVPTIVVVGAEDILTPPDLSRDIAAGIAGATLHVIPDCGHLPPIEAPEALAGLLREWLG